MWRLTASVMMILWLAAALACDGEASSASHSSDSEWQADWIGPSVPSGPNVWLAFRKSFELSEAPANATARIACDSKYWLWVNGQLAVFEGGLKRGPNRTDTYYDQIELSPYLREGRNVIALLLWHFGKHGFSHNDSGQAGLLLDAELGSNSLRSDDSWRMIKHPAFGETGQPRPNFRLAESNLRFDARKELKGWEAIDYDDSSWPNAEALASAGAAPWGGLARRPIPQWRNSGLLDYESIATEDLADGRRRVVARLPYNAQVTPYLEIDAPEGSLIDIRTDHYLGGGAPNVRAEYVARSGRQAWEALGWMNGHEVHYTLPNDVKVLRVAYRETGYDADRAGSFRCDDPDLNALWEKAYRTLYVNMRDTFFDCPDRERAQWVGDGIIEFHQVYYALDSERGPKLVRKAIREISDWQRPDGALYSPVPAGWPGEREARSDPGTGAWDLELPMQLLAYCSDASLWTYYLYTGDETTLAHVYPSVRRYLRLWEMEATGLVSHRSGDWDWPDWGANHDVPPLENAWYVLALSCAAKMAALVGENEDILWYQERLAAIRSAYNDAFWEKSAYRSADHAGEPDDRANAMAVIAGLASEERYPALRETLRRQRHASPYMEAFVLQALCLIGDHQGAMARMKERWKPQIESELTTLWEGWGIGEEGYGGGTVNHAWAGGALTVLSQRIAGLEPAEPGWRSFVARPRPGHLQKIEATAPTPFGPITLELSSSPIEATIVLQAPLDTRGAVELPEDWLSRAASIHLNGREQALGSLDVGAGRHVIRVVFE